MQKPQDVSEPAVQDVSDHLGLLALLLAMSTLRDGSRKEALCLVWYGKTNIQDHLPDRPSDERQSPNLDSIDPKYEVKVLRELPQSRDLKSFDRSQGQVVALVSGQALNCGIGPSLSYSDAEVTYLSAKDVLRWSKLSEWLDKYEQQIPTVKVALSKSKNLTHSDDVYSKLRRAKGNFEDAFIHHVPDLPESPGAPLLSKFYAVEAMYFVIDTEMLLALLVALPLVYGGIHLTTWNFHFASQIEHLLWKIACIDIIGTIPTSVIFNKCLEGSRLYNIHLYLAWILYSPTFFFYMLSRIYIVVESFISLRHVPIGVFAAIPWVQNIPHV